MEKLLAKIPQWLPHDKCLHALGALVLFIVLLPFVAPIVAVFIIAIIGLMKEWLYDAHNAGTHTVDPWDAVATLCGALLGYAVVLISSYRG